MASKEWATEDTHRSIGDVHATRVTVEQIEVSINARRFDQDVTEYHLVINGRVVMRINPYRARRLGIVTDEPNY